MIKIISGGQTGVDRAALDAALKMKLSCGGWCPKGRLAEDGAIAQKYPLHETPSEEYSQRTEWNVRDSDGILILAWGKPVGGTRLAAETACHLQKPLFVVDMKNPPTPRGVITWLSENNIKVLGIGGPRESFDQGVVYKKAYDFLLGIFKELLTKF